MLQDAFFLAHFGKAYAAAIDKLEAGSPSSRDAVAVAAAAAAAETSTTANSAGSTNGSAAPALQQQSQSFPLPSAAELAEAKSVLHTLLLGVHEELQLHGSYAAKWGVDVCDGGACRPSPATAAYCSFLMEVAQDPTVCKDGL